MRICLLGNFAGYPDEGMNKISRSFKDKLSLRHDILALNSRETLKTSFANSIRAFQPDIIHYIHGPTIRSFLIIKIAKIFSMSNAKTIISATRPYLSRYSIWAVSFLKPDLVLTQSNRFEDFLKQRSINIQFLPNGVDCETFSPVNHSEYIDIRKKLGLPLDHKIILHVGHLKTNRNLEIFKGLQKIEHVQVVIASGITERADEALKNDLQEAGIKIFHDFYENISQFYKMADLYIFALKDVAGKFSNSYNQIGAIDLPLSVLEAMACNLPVITTPYSALPRIFAAGDGLSFCRTKGEILNAVKSALNSAPINTRQKVLPYNWNRVIEQLEKIYKSTITGEPVEAML